MPQRKERPGLRALLPLPVAVLALGVAASASVYLWLRSPAALVRDFRADAAVLAYQVRSILYLVRLCARAATLVSTACSF